MLCRLKNCGFRLQNLWKINLKNTAFFQAAKAVRSCIHSCRYVSPASISASSSRMTCFHNARPAAVWHADRRRVSQSLSIAAWRALTVSQVMSNSGILSCDQGLLLSSSGKPLLC